MFASKESKKHMKKLLVQPICLQMIGAPISNSFERFLSWSMEFSLLIGGGFLFLLPPSTCLKLAEKVGDHMNAVIIVYQINDDLQTIGALMSNLLGMLLPCLVIFLDLSCFLAVDLDLDSSFDFVLVF